MEDKNHPLEENVEALLKASYPTQGQLDPRLRASMYGRLVQMLPPTPLFPKMALGLICAALLLLELLAVGTSVGLVAFPVNDLFALLTAGIVLLNLFCLPIASILIVIKRASASHTISKRRSHA
jgi:hypothetical protein